MLDTYTSIYNLQEAEFLIQATIESFEGTFQPTYLMIKQHRVTGKLYFCKTTRPDPIKYLGSGNYWTNHIKKHGKEHVETISCILFTELKECVRYAITISLSLNIANSGEWANLINENGLDGCAKGTICAQKTKDKMSESWTEERKANQSAAKLGNIPKQETKDKISATLLGRKRKQETKDKISATLLGTTHSEERKAKISESAKNVWTEERKANMSAAKLGIKTGKQKTGTCPHCGMVMALSTLKRWHLDNCKLNLHPV